MTTPVAFSAVRPHGATSHASDAGTRTYRTQTSFVAVHFDKAGKGRIVFLPDDAILRIVGPSSCLGEGLEVMFDNKLYNIFEIDLLTRSVSVLIPSRAKSAAIAVRA